MLKMNNSIFFKGWERIICAVSGVVFSFFGYKLYAIGVINGWTSVNLESNFGKFFVSGMGPGLAFMAFGAFVLIFCLVTGKATFVHTEVGARGSQQPGGGLATEISNPKDFANALILKFKQTEERLTSMSPDNSEIINTIISDISEVTSNLAVSNEDVGSRGGQPEPNITVPHTNQNPQPT